MYATTKMMVIALIDADNSTTKKERLKIITALDDNSEVQKAMPRIIRRKEAAQLLSVSLARVDQLAKAGYLKKIESPWGSRAIGIDEASIRAFIAGTGGNTGNTEGDTGSAGVNL